ncbi:YfcZ/YiiS family protein [Serratia sp. M24T3]|uniref:YfcZ/YiiS family protein n=1 Tax=Serratia sp. M24T3 TaxID=932213 RepID=UPI00025B8E71|nr:YfcZ/YiiS family protein [Serratia sp. M24T3]EIC84870.1 hypothetical protein SPM24T3_09004 [Serratia sp. M24T3]
MSIFNTETDLPTSKSPNSASSLCSAQETAACCCVDVGTIIDNTDCTASYQNVFASRADAESALEDLIQRARRVESEACDIHSEFKDVENGVELKVNFTFCCQIESINFQLALR